MTSERDLSSQGQVRRRVTKTRTLSDLETSVRAEYIYYLCAHMSKASKTPNISHSRAPKALLHRQQYMSKHLECIHVARAPQNLLSSCSHYRIHSTNLTLSSPVSNRTLKHTINPSIGQTRRLPSANLQNQLPSYPESKSHRAKVRLEPPAMPEALQFPSYYFALKSSTARIAVPIQRSQMLLSKFRPETHIVGFTLQTIPLPQSLAVLSLLCRNQLPKLPGFLLDFSNLALVIQFRRLLPSWYFFG